jgi:parallel beta-helix repeat protein
LFIFLQGQEKRLKRKMLTIIIILSFFEISIIPLGTSEQIRSKTIITVDDEPGDADYTSIKEALNHSSPSDTIEVYSGTYDEHNITITEDGISLIGMPYELGNGSDTGKPFINGNGFEGKIICADANNVTLSGFRIQNWGGQSLVSVNRKANGCVISNNYLRYAWNYAIALYSNYSKVTNNTIRDAGRYGIGFGIYGHNIVSDNVIENCEMGISLGWGGDFNTITRNRISNCSEFGIDVGGTGNIFRFNTLENNYCGLHIYQSLLCLIIQNNFFNNSYDSAFYDGISPISGNHWLLNYWERPHLLPYPIQGAAFILLPWVKFDWRPALLPYKIPTGGCE